MKKKQVAGVFGSNEIARICNVNRMLVIKWIDGGLLKSYRLPPSNFRRVRKEDLFAFMTKHNLPVENVPGLKKTVALISCPDAAFVKKVKKVLGECADFDIRQAASAYETGKLVASLQPRVLVLSDAFIALTDKKAIKRIISDVSENHLIIIAVGSKPITAKEKSRLKHFGITAYFTASVPAKDLREEMGAILCRRGLPGPAAR